LHHVTVIHICYSRFTASFLFLMNFNAAAHHPIYLITIVKRTKYVVKEKRTTIKDHWNFLEKKKWKGVFVYLTQNHIHFRCDSNKENIQNKYQWLHEYYCWQSINLNKDMHLYIWVSNGEKTRKNLRMKATRCKTYISIRICLSINFLILFCV